MPRYSIVFSDKKAGPEEAAERLKRNLPRVKNGTEALLSGPAAPEPEDVLHFREVGVAYADLTPDEATGLGRQAGIAQVRLARLSTCKPVRVVQEPRELRRAHAEDVPWNVALVRANEVWGRTTGAGVKVGIMDTGIHRSHPDLTVHGGACFVPGIDPQDWGDTHGHGTMCAGIVGAKRNILGVTGVAPGCHLYALRISEDGDSNSDWQLAGMIWAAANRMDVVSLSFFDNQAEIPPDEPPWLDLARGAELLAANGCVVIGISGNIEPGHRDHWVRNPARAERIVAVGSVTREEALSPFSRYGPDTLPERRGVEIVAPGSAIRTTSIDGGYATGSGTSFACPHVSGAVALLKEKFPTWSPDELIVRLEQTSKDILGSGRDTESGWGLIDCFRAVTENIPVSGTYNEIEGRVASVSRQGQAMVVQFEGDVTVRDWHSSDTVANLQFILRPLPQDSDASLLGASVGKVLKLFGLFLRDSANPALFRGDSLAGISLSSK